MADPRRERITEEERSMASPKANTNRLTNRRVITKVQMGRNFLK